MAARVDDGRPLSAQRRSYVACFAHFIHEARSLAAHEVIAYQGEPELALFNARAATDAACGDLDAIRAHLPLLSVERAVETPDVARAVVYAALCVDQAPAPAMRDRPAVIQRIKPLRQHMLNIARSLAEKGKLPVEKVARLGHTRGHDGLINDAAQVAEMFIAHAEAIEGLHPFTKSEIEGLRDDAEWLRENTRPRGARRPRRPRPSAAVSDRDRLWTLLVRRHSLLRQIAGYFHPDDVASIVPPLKSRVRATSSADELVDRPL